MSENTSATRSVDRKASQSTTKEAPRTSRPGAVKARLERTEKPAEVQRESRIGQPEEESEQGVSGLLRGFSSWRSSSPEDDEAPEGYGGDPDNALGERAEVLQENLDALDTAAGGSEDGIFGLDDLEAIAQDENADKELREAVQAILADPNMLNALDVADGEDLDRVFSNGDLERVIEESRTSDDSRRHGRSREC